MRFQNDEIIVQAALKERKLQQVLSQERLRSDQLRMLRDNAIVQRYGGYNTHKPEPAWAEIVRGELSMYGRRPLVHQ